MNERRVIINLDLIEQLDLSINEFCAIWGIHANRKLPFNDSNVNYRELERKKFIKIIKNEKNLVTFVLREKAIAMIDLLIKGNTKSCFKKQKDVLNIDVLTRLPEFRDKWKGLKPGSMGSLQSCKDKILRWMNENPEYTFDQILAAADNYIDSLKGDYRFLQRADYFIYKQNGHKEDESRLSSHIDEVDDKPAGDWTTQLI